MRKYEWASSYSVAAIGVQILDLPRTSRLGLPIYRRHCSQGFAENQAHRNIHPKLQVDRVASDDARV